MIPKHSQATSFRLLMCGKETETFSTNGAKVFTHLKNYYKDGSN